MPAKKKRTADDMSGRKISPSNATLDQVGRLLWSEDKEHVRQGIDLFLMLADEEVWWRLGMQLSVDSETGTIRTGDSFMMEYRPDHLRGQSWLHVNFLPELALRAAHATGRLHELRSLKVYPATLQNLDIITTLTSLEHLDLSGGDALSELNGIGSLTNLRSLDISGCGGLLTIQPVGALRALEVLDVSMCTQLSTLSGVGRLKSLRSLSCRSVPVTDFDDLWRATTLEELHLSNCAGLTNLNGIARLVDLRIVELEGCESLTDISALGSLPALQSLKLDLHWNGEEVIEGLEGSVSIDWIF